MAIFDSLGYARFMANLVTKDDLDVQTLRITVRLAAMLAAGFGIMTAVIGIMLRFH